MRTDFHTSNSRGTSNIGWLKSSHTFSFSNYLDTERMGFGKLRVINDDYVSPEKGFDTHPHENMEIISIPLFGSLEHKDTLGNEFVIQSGEVQVMSAGTGIMHSEYNHSKEEDVNFLQIWILPSENGLLPEYGQAYFSEEGRLNQFQLLASPDKRNNSLKINQNAFISMAQMSPKTVLGYKKHSPKNGVYFFLVSGRLKINNQPLSTRDGFGIWDADKIQLASQRISKVLVIEVPE